MSEIAMTVAAGRSDRNSGELGSVDVLGVLYVGGSGMWRFTLVNQDSGAPAPTQVVMLDSQRNLLAEIRAGVALALDLGEAKEMAEKIAGSDWANKRLEFTDEQLNTIGNQSRSRELALLITSMDESLTEELTTHVDDAGWSIHLATVTDKHVETQWGTA